MLTDIVHIDTVTQVHGFMWNGENIRDLKQCQAIWKRKLIAKKLTRSIYAITEIYYSPGCKGEYIAQRSFLTKSGDVKNKYDVKKL